REALTNVIRHSHASKVDIQLSQKNSQLAGSLIDNGVGFNVVQHDTGLGLPAMAKRVKKSGGELFVSSSPGSGTKIVFSVPRNPESNDSALYRCLFALGGPKLHFRQEVLVAFCDVFDVRR